MISKNVSAALSFVTDETSRREIARGRAVGVSMEGDMEVGEVVGRDCARLINKSIEARRGRGLG